MRFSPNRILTEAAEGIQVHRGTALCDTIGERAFAMVAGTAVIAAADGSEAVALGMGSRAIARGPGARAIADGQDTSAQAYGAGAIAIAINGGTATAFEGATVFIEKAQPVDPSVEYAKFYDWTVVGVGTGFGSDKEYCCHVSKDGEPPTRMLRTEAQELQRELGDTVEWFQQAYPNLRCTFNLTFAGQGIYTYKTKATIKLDGRMVTPEQAATEWDAKKETCDFYYSHHDNEFFIPEGQGLHPFSEAHKPRYEFRPKTSKQVKWESVPVGTLTNRGIFLKSSHGFAQVLTTDSPYCVSDVADKELELAPASEQPWIAVQEKSPSLHVDGLVMECWLNNGTVVDSSMVPAVTWSNVAYYAGCGVNRYRITGIAQGWKL